MGISQEIPAALPAVTFHKPTYSVTDFIFFIRNGKLESLFRQFSSQVTSSFHTMYFLLPYFTVAILTVDSQGTNLKMTIDDSTHIYRCCYDLDYHPHPQWLGWTSCSIQHPGLILIKYMIYRNTIPWQAGFGFLSKFHRNSLPGEGVTKPFFSVPSFSTFSVIAKTSVSYRISRLYVTGAAAPQLRWHLSNMNVIQGI